MNKLFPEVADEAWKVLVRAHDARRADELISSLIYILTDVGHNYELGLSKIKEMSGEQIVNSIIEFQKAAHQSVIDGLNKNRLVNNNKKD